jgi:hypothetical protein
MLWRGEQRTLSFLLPARQNLLRRRLLPVGLVLLRWQGLLPGWHALPEYFWPAGLQPGLDRKEVFHAPAILLLNLVGSIASAGFYLRLRRDE